MRRINKDEGLSVLLVEQNAVAALEVVSHGYLIESGRIVMHDSAEAMKKNPDIQEFYLGGREGREFPRHQALPAAQALADLKRAEPEPSGASGRRRRIRKALQLHPHRQGDDSMRSEITIHTGRDWRCAAGAMPSAAADRSSRCATT